MKRNTITQRIGVTSAIMIVTSALFLMTGCNKKDDNPLQSTTTIENAATDDAVLSIAGALADDNGGAANNMGDVIALASPDGIGALAASLSKEYGVMNEAVIDSSYDPATGWWSVTVSKQRNSSSDLYYAALTRSYRYQFLKNNIPQRSWRVVNGTGTDTATVIKFVIVSGAGEYKTPHIHHLLQSLSASFTATNTNTDTITVNSDAPYIRSGLDTLTTANATRTLDHTVTMNFIDIKGPRLRPNSVFLTRKNLMNQTTGIVQGTYAAKVTVQRGTGYSEKTIDRTFTITLSGGEGAIGIRGEGRRFRFNLTNGDQKF